MLRTNIVRQPNVPRQRQVQHWQQGQPNVFRQTRVQHARRYHGLNPNVSSIRQALLSDSNTRLQNALRRQRFINPAPNIRQNNVGFYPKYNLKGIWVV